MKQTQINYLVKVLEESIEKNTQTYNEWNQLLGTSFEDAVPVQKARIYEEIQLASELLKKFK